jgi:TetR/AcrR family transcriptional repressor of nem operon
MMNDIETKTKILDVAQDLIQRCGANGMSYQHISEAVGIRKPSIHYYFPTKEDLIKALLDRYGDNFLDTVDLIIESEDSAKLRLQRYIALFEATLCAGNKDKACLYGMLGAELASLGKDSAAKIRHFYDENEKRLTRILDDGRKSKEFRFEGDSRATATLIFSLLEGAMLIARAQDGVKQFKSVAQQLMSLLNA